jgi:hypothetical protein
MRDFFHLSPQRRGDFHNTLMVRRRFFSAVSNHEMFGPSFETRAQSALLRMRTV